MPRFRRESSQTRKRTYARTPTKRTLRIDSVGRWLAPAGVVVGGGGGAGLETSGGVAGGVVAVLTPWGRPDVPVFAPTGFVAVRETRIVPPMSAARTPYVRPV